MSSTRTQKASLKSFRRKDEVPTPPPDDPGNPTVNFHGESRRNDTHQSTTDPDAQLARKGQGKEAKLSYLLRDVVNKVADIHFTASDELHTLGALYETMLASDGNGVTVFRRFRG